MKKTISVLLIVIMLLNLISTKSFAFDTNAPMSLSPQENAKVILQNDDGNKLTASITGTTYSGSTIFKIIASVITFLPQIVNQMLDAFVQFTTNDKSVDKFTIYDTVMGHYDLFDIDFLHIPQKLEEDSTLMEQMKYHVIKYYVIMRNMALGLSIFVLLYIGIRMATSSLAADKAKYQKMLISWLASVMLIFFMQFIVIVISVVLNKGLEMIGNLAKAWQISSFEEDIYSGAINNLTVTGFNMFSTVAIILILTWYQLKFFIYYLHRSLEVNFLIIISPLVTVTYAIDKAGDGTAQAFGEFIKEIIGKSAIQLLHAVLYVVFIATAGVVATYNPILAILFFALLSRAEKIVKKIFSVSENGIEGAKIPFLEGKK